MIIETFMVNFYGDNSEIEIFETALKNKDYAEIERLAYKVSQKK